MQRVASQKVNYIKQLSKAKSELEAAGKSTPCGVILLDQETVIKAINAQALELLNPNLELLGSKLSDFIQINGTWKESCSSGKEHKTNLPSGQPLTLRCVRSGKLFALGMWKVESQSKSVEKIPAQTANWTAKDLAKFARNLAQAKSISDFCDLVVDQAQTQYPNSKGFVCIQDANDAWHTLLTWPITDASPIRLSFEHSDSLALKLGEVMPVSASTKGENAILTDELEINCIPITFQGRFQALIGANVCAEKLQPFADIVATFILD